MKIISIEKNIGGIALDFEVDTTHSYLLKNNIISHNSMRGILQYDTEGEEESKMLPKTSAPKRPKELRAEAHTFVIQKRSYYAVVGLMDDDVYEIFTGENHNDDGSVYIPKNVKEGTLIKEKKRHYVFKTSDGQEFIMTNGHSDDSADALTRQISASLRHGTPLDVVVHSLEKSKGSMVSFSKALSRTLKKYIKDGAAVHGEKCPECGSNLIRFDGCIKCSSGECSWTKCG